MDYTKTCDTIINYLVDKNIKGNENDTTLSKIEKFLLKYKRIIAIVLLILLLYIGNQCNLSYLNINVNHKKEYVLNGGELGAGTHFKSDFKKMGSSISSKASSIKSSLGKLETYKNAKDKTYDYGAKYANKFKDNASVFYGFVYSIAITILMFLIFVPAVGFIVIGFICYALLKNRMKAIKGL